MKKILVIIIIFISGFTQSQPKFIFPCDSNFVPYSIRLVESINDKKISRADFEFRIWSDNGISRPSKVFLFDLLYVNNKWIGQYLTFDELDKTKCKVSRQKIRNVNLDSLFNYLNQNNFLTLPSQRQLIIRAAEEHKTAFQVADGEEFQFEIITPSCQRSYIYHCPRGYLARHEYLEYKNVVNILNRILYIIGKKLSC